MNKVFKVIWNHVTQTWVAASELSKAHGKTKSSAAQKAAAVAVSALAATSGIASAAVNDPVLQGTTDGARTLAVGTNSKATGPDTTAVGYGAIAGTNKDTVSATAIGSSASASAKHALAIGGKTKASGDGAIAIGFGSEATGTEAVAIGGSNWNAGVASRAQGDQSIAIGPNTKAVGHSSVVIGNDDLVSALRSNLSPNSNILIGDYKITNGKDKDGQAVTIATALEKLTGIVSSGNPEVNGGNPTGLMVYRGSEVSHGSVAVGVQSIAKGELATAIGTSSNASAVGSVALGVAAETDIGNSVAIGAGSTTKNAHGTKELSRTIFGKKYDFAGGSNTDEGDVVSFGKKNYERQLKNVAAGEISVNSTDGINGSQLYSVLDSIQKIKYLSVNSTVGNANTEDDGSNINNNGAKGTNSIAIGPNATTVATSENAVVMGFNSSANATNSTVIGANANASAAGGVALGNSSVASVASGIEGAKPFDDGRTNKYTNLTGAVLTSTLGAVSVGNGSTATRQITGLAAGTNDTDAVNVAQLKSVNLKIAGNNGKGDVLLTNQTLTVDGNSTYITSTASNNKITFDLSETAKKKLEKDVVVAKGKNVTIDENTPANSNTTTYTVNAWDTTVSTSDTLKLTNTTTDAEKTRAYTIDLSDATKAQLKKEETVVAKDGETNITVKAKEAKNATGGTEFEVSLNKDINLTNDGSLKVGPVTINKNGIDAGDQKITNVGDPVGDKDAVNLKTLKEKELHIKQGEYAIKDGKVELTYVDGNEADVADKKVTITGFNAEKVVAKEGADNIASVATKSGEEAGKIGETYEVSVSKNAVKDAAREAVIVKSGKNTTVTPTKDETNHTTTYVVDTDFTPIIDSNPFEYVNKEGKPVVKSGDKFYAPDQIGEDGKPIENAVETPVGDVVIHAKGNETKPLTNIASNLPDTRNTVDGDKTVTKSQAAPTDVANITNNAATVGDVLNAGWNVQGNDAPVDFVKAYDTVNFVDGTNTNVEVTSDGNTTNVKVNLNDEVVLGGKPLDENGEPLVKVGDKFYKPDQLENGKPKDGEADNNVTPTSYSPTTTIGKDGISVGQPGKDGEDGKDGVTITADAEGNGAIGLNGKDGASADFKVIKGKDGVDGKPENGVADKKDRLAYTPKDADGNPIKGEDGKPIVEEVATLNDGLRFTGNNESTENKHKLNTLVKVQGQGLTEEEAKTFTGTDDNINVTADGNATLSIALSKDLKNLNTVELVEYEEKDGKQVVKDKAPKTKLNNDGIEITPVAEDGSELPNQSVSLTKDGLNNGDNNITNVKGNLAPTYNEGDKTEVNGKPSETEVAAAPTKSQTAPDATNVSKIYNNAATVGDVLNAGWNLKENGAERDFVKPYDTVNFVNGVGTIAKVSTDDNKVSTVTFDIDKATVENKDGKIKEPTSAEELANLEKAVKDAEDAKNALTEDAPQDEKDAADKKLADAKKALNDAKKLGDQVVTADQLAKAVNNTGWYTNANGDNLGAAKSDKDVLVKPGDKVLFEAGKNLTLTPTFNNGETIYNYALADTISFGQPEDKDGNPLTKVGDKYYKPTDLDESGNPKVVDGKPAEPVTPAKTEVTLGKDGLDNGGNKITNVAPGEAPTDAVNVSQLDNVKDSFPFETVPNPNAVKDGDEYYDKNDIDPATGKPKPGAKPVSSTVINAKGDTPQTINNVKGNLAPTYNEGDKTEVDGKPTGTAAAEPTKSQAAPENVADIYNNAATVGDVLNAGFNLKENGAEKDFVKPYDTVNFVNGTGTIANVTVSEDGKVSDVTFNIDKAEVKTKEGKIVEPLSADKLANLNEAVKDAEKAKQELAANPDATEEMKQAADENLANAQKALNDAKKAGDQVVTAQELANAVNNTGWKTNVKGGNADDDVLVKPGDKVEFAAGSNLDVAIKSDPTNGTTTYTYSLKDKITFGGPADSEGNPLTKANDGKYYPKDQVDEQGNPKVVNGTPATPVEPATTEVTLGKDGLDNGGNTISNVTSGLETYPDPTKAPDATDETQPDPKAGLVNLNNENVPDSNAATVGDLRKMGWVVSSDKTTGGEGEFSNQVKNADEVKFVGTGLATVSGKTDKETGVSTITVDVDAQKTAEAAQLPVVYTDAEGNKLTKEGDKFYRVKDGKKVDAKGNPINITENMTEDEKAAELAKSEVKNGDVIASLNNGNNDSANVPTALSNVKGNLAPTYNAGDNKVDGVEGNNTTKPTGTTAAAPTKSVEAPKPADVAKIYNNAATVGDVLNAGFNLKENGAEKDFVKPYDTVNFVNGVGTIASVVTDAAGKVSDVTFNIDKAEVKTADGKITVPVKPEELTKLGDAVKAAEKAKNDLPQDATEEQKKAADKKLADAQNALNNARKPADQVVTAQELANAVNNTGWKTNAVGANKRSEDVLVKPGDKVEFAADGNLNVGIKSDNGTTTYTYGLNDQITLGKPSEMKDGKPVDGTGTDGKLTVQSKDGKDGVTVTAKDGEGSIGLNGKDGANANITVGNGPANLAGQEPNRIKYTSTKPVLDKDGKPVLENGQPKTETVTENVATLNDGLKFAGDNGATVINKKLNEKLEIVGGADKAKLSDNNIGVNAKDGKLEVKLAKELKDLTSAEFKDGDVTTKVDGKGVTITPTEAGKAPVSLTKDGLNNGDNNITNVKGNLAPTYNNGDKTEVNGKPTGSAATATKSQTAPDAKKVGEIYNNAATVGDVLNAGFNLQENGTAKDFVKPYDTVNFVNGTGTVANVTTSADGKVSNVTFSIDKADVSVDGNGKLIDNARNHQVQNLTHSKENLNLALEDLAKATANGTPADIDAAKAKVTAAQKAVDDAEKSLAKYDQAAPNKVVTLPDLVKQFEQTGWKVTSGEEGSGKAEGTTTELVNPSETVTLKAGNNLKVVQNGSDFTYSLADEVTFKADPNKPGTTDVKLSNAGLNNGGNTITNVARGVNPTDAVNVSQLNEVKGDIYNINNKVDDLDKRVRGIGANAAATASLPQVILPGKSMMAAAVGGYGGASALAVGYSRASDNGKLILKIQGTANTEGNLSGGVGMGYQW
ncbi:YadA-like family protein [Neisseria lisongii]|uniref:YadA-like family protein n=1 Tax=Neisseria lisongii TaxID=2912188 RepID=A0AAW5ALB8_9NEIS|nr:YadA-like family protein [Neisseria lisongii]MCF7529221.1 YadA-like family protein [Neisseria lisongii]